MTFESALAALVTAGVGAGLDAAQVRTEGERFAAAVAESAPGAPTAWLAATGRHGTAAFFEAAVSARRWRSAPTDLLSSLLAAGGGERASGYVDALAGVAAAAATLGTPSQAGALAAVEAATAQRLALGGSALEASSLATTALPPQGNFTLPTPQLTDLGSLPDVAAILQALGGFQAGLPGATGALRTPGALPGLPGAQPGSPTSGSPAPGGPATAVAGESAVATEAAAEPAEPEKTLEELLAQLDDLVGLNRAKDQVRRQVELLRVEKLRTEAGLTTPTLTRHLVFVGNPGTGKTTVARLVSGIYRALGLLSKGHLVEVDRSELVAGYLGQTAQKTSEVVASAIGGVLFIDEAYSLTQGTTGPDQYGSEAVNTLVKDMEDHRDDLVVIVAGYPAPMADFIATNPGLESRFATTISFDDYTDPELRDIFARMAQAADFEPTPEALERVQVITTAQPRHSGFGNARFVRNLLDSGIAHHAWRLKDVPAPTIEQLRLLEASDLIAPETRTPPEGLQGADAVLAALGLAPVDETVLDETVVVESDETVESTDQPDLSPAPSERTQEA